MPISVVFDPPLPSDSPSTFNTKAFTLLGDLNDWSTQANALPGEVATNLSALLASPPAIGGTTPAAGSFTTLSASGAVTLAGATIDIKDASNGIPGLTLFKLNLRNAANTVTSWFTTAATSARTWTMPDKDGTVAMLSDITGTISGTNTGDETTETIKAKLGITTLSGSNTGDQTIPTTLPASDVYPWAKAATKPTYTAAEVGLGSVNNTADAAKSVNYATTAGSAPANGGTSAACSGNAATATRISGTSTWNLLESAGVLYFQVSGVSKAKLDASGNLTVIGNVSAYGAM